MKSLGVALVVVGVLVVDLVLAIVVFQRSESILLAATIGLATPLTLLICAVALRGRSRGGDRS